MKYITKIPLCIILLLAGGVTYSMNLPTWNNPSNDAEEKLFSALMEQDISYKDRKDLIQAAILGGANPYFHYVNPYIFPVIEGDFDFVAFLAQYIDPRYRNMSGMSILDLIGGRNLRLSPQTTQNTISIIENFLEEVAKRKAANPHADILDLIKKYTYILKQD